MKTRYDELIDMVKVKMEEYTPFAETTLIAAPEEIGFEVRPIVSYIEQTIEESANEILLQVPLHYIEAQALRCEAVYLNDIGYGKIELSSDYIRPHTIHMATWRRPVHVCSKWGDPKSRLQYNRWTRGGQEKPVIVERSIPSGKAELYYYTISPDYVFRMKENGLLENSEETDHEGNLFWRVKEGFEREVVLSSSRQVNRFDKNAIQKDLMDFYASRCASKIMQYYGLHAESVKMEEELQKKIGVIG